MGTNGIELAVETSEHFALAPLVDKIAYGIARGLVVAMKELENHIASETRKVGDAMDRRLDTLQTSLQDLYGFASEQRSINSAVQGQLQDVTGKLQETDARHTAASDALSQRMDATAAELQGQTKALSESVAERIAGLSRELGVQQEDLAAVKTTLCAFSARIDVLVERLDRQADAVRTMYSAYSQRETELEQLVDGLARLRAFPTPLPSNGL